MPKCKPTKSEIERYERLAGLGCICCRKLGLSAPAEIHHIVEGIRLGNLYTIPLCAWHHRGVPRGTYKQHTYQQLGPNLRDHKKAFKNHWGWEMELWKETNKWLEGENPQEIKAQQQSESSLPF